MKKIIILTCFYVALFSCSQELEDNSVVSDVDGNTYKVVNIGKQCWMAENLRTVHYSDGTLIPLGNSELENEEIESSRYYFNYDSLLQNFSLELFEYLNSSSKFYNWAAATNLQSTGSETETIQGVCPDGWHLPTKSEWEELISFVGEDTAGRNLKSSDPQHWRTDSLNHIGTDDYGFKSVGNGGRFGGGYFIMGNIAHYWSSSMQENDDKKVCIPSIFKRSKEVEWKKFRKTYSFCVRCVKNK